MSKSNAMRRSEVYAAGFARAKKNMGCAGCGYRRNGNALVFRQKGEKPMKINASTFGNTGKPRLTEAIAASALLCGNCIAEINDGDRDDPPVIGAVVAGEIVQSVMAHAQPKG